MFRRRMYYVQEHERRGRSDTPKRDTSFSSFMCILFIFAMFTWLIVIGCNWRFLFTAENKNATTGRSGKLMMEHATNSEDSIEETTPATTNDQKETRNNTSTISITKLNKHDDTGTTTEKMASSKIRKTSKEEEEKGSDSWSKNDGLYKSTRDSTTTMSTNENVLLEDTENVDTSSNTRPTDQIDQDSMEFERIVYGPTLRFPGKTTPGNNGTTTTKQITMSTNTNPYDPEQTDGASTTNSSTEEADNGTTQSMLTTEYHSDFAKTFDDSSANSTSSNQTTDKPNDYEETDNGITTTEQTTTSASTLTTTGIPADPENN